MADAKLTAVGAMTPVLTDIMYGVDDPGGTPASGKHTYQVLMDLLEANFAAPSTAIVSGTMADARISESSVTQHGAAITAGIATLVVVTDNESTDEENPVVFVAGADPDGGNLGLETDGTMTYNPSSGLLTATGFVGALTGEADTVTTNANLTGMITSTGNAAILGAFTVAQLSAALSDATLSGNNTGDEAAASVTVVGVVELATIAETNTGTSATLAVTPDGLAGSVHGIHVETIEVFGMVAQVNNATGDGKAFFRVPSTLNGMNLVAAAAVVETAGTTGTLDVQIHNRTQAADMLSTLLTIDSAETDTLTATALVIDAAEDDVATGDLLRIDVDAVHTTPAKGLIVQLHFATP